MKREQQEKLIEVGKSVGIPVEPMVVDSQPGVLLPNLANNDYPTAYKWMMQLNGGFAPND